MNYRKENRNIVIMAVAAAFCISLLVMSTIEIALGTALQGSPLTKLVLAILAATITTGIVAAVLTRRHNTRHEQIATKADVLAKQIEHILDATRTGLDIIDQEHNIRFVDPQSRKKYGDPSGKKCYEYFMGRTRPCDNCTLERAIKAQSSSAMEIVMPRENNRPVQITTIPFRGEDGKWLAAEVHIDLTDQMNAEMSLLKAYEELKELESIIYRSPMIVFTWKYEPNWPVTYVSRNIEKYGYTPEDLTSGRVNTMSIIHTQDLPKIQAEIQQFVAEKKTEYIQDFRAFAKSGEIRSVENRGKIIYDDQMNVKYIQGILIDVTEKRQAEEELRRYRDNLEAAVADRTAELIRANQELNREIKDRTRAENSLVNTEKRFQALFENTAIGIIIADVNGKFLDSNAAALRILGYESQDLKSLELLAVTHADDRAVTNRLLADLASGKVDTYTIEKRYIHKDGKIVWCQVQATPIKDAKGNTEFIVGAIIDITDKKLAQLAMRASEASYREIFEAANDAIFIQDLDGVILDLNKRALQLYDCTFDEIYGKNIASLCIDPPPYSPQDARRWIDRAKTQGPQRFLWGIKNKKGKQIWVEMMLKKIILSGNDRLLAVVRDATDQKNAEDALHKEHARAKKLVDSVNAIVITMDGDGKITAFNKFGLNLTGLKENQTIGKKWQDVFGQCANADDKTEINPLSAIENPDNSFNTDFTATEGKRLSLQWHFSAMGNMQEPSSTILAVGYDVTDVKIHEQQMRQGSKTQAVMHLANKIAHDFNNQLTIIKGYCELLIDGVAKNNPLHEQISEINDAAARVSELTTQLLAFGRNHKLKPTKIDLAAVLAENTAMLKTLINKNVSLAINSGDAQCPIMADVNQLRHVIINLVTNARDAMPKGGTISIDLSTAQITPDIAQAHSITPGQYAVMTVRDGGVGMDKKTLSQIFELFFTTKPSGKGSGLGLAIVDGFVRQSGGYIEVESTPGEGSSFRIFLPKVASGE